MKAPPGRRLLQAPLHLVAGNGALGMSVSGYRKLEQGQRSIAGPTAVLLRIIDKEPEAVRRALATP